MEEQIKQLEIMVQSLIIIEPYIENPYANQLLIVEIQGLQSIINNLKKLSNDNPKFFKTTAA